MPDHASNPRYPILLKEIDQIHDAIKNLDDIIYKTKNFAIVLWSGSLYLIAQHVNATEKLFEIAKEDLLVFCTALIPLIFWAIHFRWQKHLSMTGQRERMISWFINSPAFLAWLKGDETIKFPVYDIPGWLYTKQGNRNQWREMKIEIDEDYLLDHSELSFWKTLLYKDAKWYYSLMAVVSLLFGILR